MSGMRCRPHIQETESGSQSLCFKRLKSCPEYEASFVLKSWLLFAFYNCVILSITNNRVIYDRDDT